MNKFYLLLSLLILASCNQEKRESLPATPTTLNAIPSISLSSVMNDSISVRALDYGGDNYWFAGNTGTYGKIDAKTGTLEKSKIQLEDHKELEFRSIAVTDQFTYILTAGNPALIYKIAHANDEVELVYTEYEERVFYDSMRFWDDQEGIAFGDPTEDCLSVIKTFDGGLSWAKCKCTYMPEFIPGEAAFAASNSNIAVQGDHVWLATGGAAARILHSKDRGSTWEEYATPMIAGSEMAGIFAIDFYDQELGVMIGGNWEDKKMNTYNKAITYDGGRNWKLMANGNDPGYCSDIIFVPGTKGKELMAVGTNGIWWSGDQGANWSQLSDEGFYTVKMIDQSNGYLAGHHNISRFTISRN
ncbi:sialidase family protein [Nonlabens xiamenensis]|uniref:sialidase family protein n=1 Tax=Nonlabens xiamenensis TaxID=2341043 RepID=UPI000F61000E|nr:exo-alpha-sialidase [Nonlabens xiamenensis]